MTVKIDKQRRKTLAWTLMVGAVSLEILNSILAFHFARLQANVCPKESFPGEIVIGLTVISIILAFAAGALTGKYKMIGLLLALSWALLIILGGYFLLFPVARGGINWCGFVW